MALEATAIASVATLQRLSEQEIEELRELRKKHAALKELFEDTSKELHQVRQANENLSKENLSLKTERDPRIEKLEARAAQLAANAINFGKLGLLCVSVVPEALAILPKDYPYPDLPREDYSEELVLKTLIIFKDAISHLKKQLEEAKALPPKKNAQD